MSPAAAAIVAQIFGTVLIALLVEDRATAQRRSTHAAYGEFLSAVFMVGLGTAGVGLFVALPPVVWDHALGSGAVWAVGACLSTSLFALVVPAADRLPLFDVGSERWNTVLKSVLVVLLVWVVAGALLALTW